MKVKKLIKELRRLDPEALVYVSSDEEGNSFNKAAGAWAYKAIDHGYEIDLINQEDVIAGEYDEEDLASAIDVVVVWP